MAKQNPFKKASRAKQHVKLLISGGSGAGKSLTAIQLACHMAAALGKPGSVAVADSEDGTALLYSFDEVMNEPYMCACEQCLKSAHRLPLEFDHIDMRDHSPDLYQENMRAAYENGYAVLVVDSASHEWCGVNGCLEQVDQLKGDGRGRQTDNAWNIVTQKHNAFLADIRSIPINLICTARTKPGRGDDAGQEIIIQRDKDGPFEYEFQMWATTSRSQPGTLHIRKSRSGHFEGVSWKKAGKFAAEQLLLWAGQIRQDPPRPQSDTPAGEGRAQPVKRSADARPSQAATPPKTEVMRRDPKTCKHPSWSADTSTDAKGEITGTSCDACGLFREDDAPPVEDAEVQDDEANAKDEAAGRALTELVEAITPALDKLPAQLSAPYRAEFGKCSGDPAKLANILACLDQLALVAECMGHVDEETAGKWEGFAHKVFLDVSKLEAMVGWCEKKLHEMTTAAEEPAAT